MTIPFWKMKQKLAPYLFISPFIILFIIFLLIPLGFAVILAFNSWNGVGDMKLIGLKNFTTLFKDKVFLQSIWNGIVLFIMYVPIMLLLALILAVIMNRQDMPGRNFYRAAFYIPNITSTVAVAFIFMLAFDTKYGIVNLIINKLSGGGTENISWIGTTWGARSIVCFVVIWRWLGYNMILLLAGLQNISKELYEAASLDGASARQVFISITLPLMKPLLLFCTVLSTIGTFSLFTEPQILTRGGPMYKTITPVLYIYNESFTRLRMGYSASIGIVFFLLMFTFTIIQFRIAKDTK